MRFYSLPKEIQDRLTAAGVDYDLQGAIEENETPFQLEDIERVLAYHEGERDSENDYEWIVRLLDGRVAYLIGWQDYTGWDCRSGLDVTFAESPRQAVGLAKNKKELLSQVNSHKQETWYEKTNKELGLNK